MKTIAELQSDFEAGRTTVRALAEAYLARIESLDRGEPGLGAVLELAPDALEAASALDEEWRDRGPRGPLHGVPILIKGNVETGDGTATSAGSLALVDHRLKGDAFLVERLRAAGALILGKTNLSEWANFRSLRSTSGWSSLGGQTRNPYALDRNPSGSSSGSAVAVAADLCVAAVGTETDGSIVAPASANGIVGIKPTVGRVSRSGIIPIAHSQDTAGPMARTVADAALLLAAMAGTDPDDEGTRRCPDELPPIAPDRREARGLAGVKAGVARTFFGFNEGVDARIGEAVAVLRRLGAEIVDPTNLETARSIHEPEMEVLLHEFKANLNAYLRKLPPAIPVHSLEDLIAFNEENAGRMMPHFGQEIFLRAAGKGDLSCERYHKAVETCRRYSRDEGIDEVLARYGLDVLVAPTAGPAWKTDWVLGDRHDGGCSTLPAVAGYPHVTVPAGFVGGLPVGISFFGPAHSEGMLIRCAHAFEEATNHRRAPRFLPTLEG
jgi:amidase